MKLSGKTAFVTGAGSGIGEAIAERFVREGAMVYLADIDAVQGAEVAGRLSPDGSQAAFIRLDVADPAQTESAARDVLLSRGRLDILVNNAGIGHVGTIEQTTAADLDRMHSVNVRGVFNCSKAFVGSMIEHGSGSIVNMASVGGLVGIVDRLAYVATKFAVVGLTKSMALDHATTGVRVNCICPGRVETPFVKARLAEYDDPDSAYREMSMSQPVGRMATPEEIADAALFLASDASAFMTGSSLVVDGGFTAGR